MSIALWDEEKDSNISNIKEKWSYLIDAIELTLPHL